MILPAAAAAGLGVAATAAAGVHRVGREELAHGEGDGAEELAGVLVGAAVDAATAGALLVGQAVIQHGNQQLAVPLQADDGELAQGDKDPTAVVAHGEIAVKALAHAGRKLADITVTAAAVAALQELGIQDHGVHSLHNGDGHVALLQELAVQAVHTDLGGENFGAALAAEEDHRSEERRVGKECRSRWSPYH